MKPSSVKAKGRRLQTETAESLGVRLNLTIDAEPPTKPGRRSSGAIYVPEGTGDLRIRRMGQPGADVVPISKVAQDRLRLNREPLHIECKNVETFDLMTILRTRESPAWLTQAFRQCDKKKHPLVVLRKNRMLPMAFTQQMRNGLWINVSGASLAIQFNGIIGFDWDFLLGLLARGCQR